jgi:4-hydroxy-L-threonine phosphate dehydrogenase PdxA
MISPAPKPLLAISMGDPCGIGPEEIVAALAMKTSAASLISLWSVMPLPWPGP